MQASYCTRQATDLEMVEDAITGKSLDLSTQTIYITTDASEDATGTGISGVQRPEYVDAKGMAQLAKLLMARSPHRVHGTHEGQDILIRADPGTGKTWSIRQLTLLLATELRGPSSEPVSFVPLLVPVQRLAVFMRKATEQERSSDLIAFYIEKAFDAEDRKLLLQVQSTGPT